MRRIEILLPVLLVTSSIGLVGCRVSGKSFQIDSDNQTPSFGIHLVPAKKKARKIRQTTHEQAGEQERAESEEVKRSSGRKNDFSRWKKWLNPLASAPRHIPLPRTDLSEDDEETSDDPDSNDKSVSFDDF